MIVYNNQAPKNVNNVGQFGATEGTIGAYKSAAEYAADSKYWALLSQTKYSSVEEILAEVERLYAQGHLLEEDIKQLKSDFESQEQVLLGLIQSTGTAIDNTNAATELSKEATQNVLAQLDIISNMTVQTTLLPPGSLATGSYDNATGVFAFGIPEGKPGRDGTDGTIGDIGSVPVGTPVVDDYGFYVDKDDGGLYRADMSDIANLIPSVRSVSINGGAEQTGSVVFDSVSTFNGRKGAVVPATGDYTAAQVGAFSVTNNLSEITDTSAAITNIGLAEHGIGSPTLTKVKAMDWQTFNFVNGGNYSVLMSNITNAPAEINYPANYGLYLEVIGVVTGGGEVRVVPGTNNNNYYSVFSVSWTGGVGSRVFTVREELSSARPVTISQGGTGATTASAARTKLGLGLVSTESIVPITKGGTGATSSENARLALVAAKSGDNSDITSMTNKVTFTQSPVIPDAVDDNDAVALRQLHTSEADLLARLKSSNAGEGASLITFENGNSVESLSSKDGAKNIGSGERSLLVRNNDIKHSGDFPTLQAAVNASLPKNDLIVSPGEYSEAITIGSTQLKGVGGATVLKAPSNFTDTIQVKASTPHWQFRHSGGFAIDGSGTTGAVGISFDPTDQYAGRHNFSDVYIHNINKAIQKPSGNIGNTWKGIGVQGCDWGYWAQSASEMHLGSDTLQNMHFDGISTYCVYLNATTGEAPGTFGGGVGGWWIKDSIMEASGGGGIYLKNKDGDCPTAPCGVSNVWMEAIATTPAINVDGVSQKPRVLKLIDTSIFFAEYTYLNNVELQNSNLVTYGCRVDNSDGHMDISVDANSSFVADQLYLNGSSGKDVMVRSVAAQTGKIGQSWTPNMSMRGYLPEGYIYRVPGNKLVVKPFDGGTAEFSGTASSTGSLQPQGQLSQSCMYFEIPGAAEYELTGAAFQITSGNWYVWGISTELVQGTPTNFRIGGDINVGEVFTKGGQWVSTFGVAQASASGSVNLRLSTAGTGGVVLRLADYFVAEFTTQAEAMRFANSRRALR
ncbi:tail fibers protein [Escherichia phage ES17]|uniref:Tail fibers protein n=1 Tax=Escherichia phage ES17 TaxID=2662277 RepID=A0A7U3QG61_9CAUD|nr:tail fiber protein [Escherichia phage ES17]QPL11059.1 tail fibers protein [Escherichia phage ES17]